MLDQAAHFTVGFLIALICTSNVFAGAIIGISLWLVREFTEWQLKPNHGPAPWKGHGNIFSSGSLLDLVFWTLGGVVGSLL